MSRKTYLGMIAIIGVLLASAEAAEKAPPNFIIFYMDDLSWAQTSVRMMDSEPESVSDFYHTPGVERLAERGMRFTNGCCPTPTCTGSRISIQFGKTSARMQYRFLMVSHYAVHVAHAATGEALARWQKKYDDLENKPDDAQALQEFNEEHNALYGAMLEEADANLGLLMDELEKASELDNTYIVFTADNGSGCIRRDADGFRFCGALKEGMSRKPR